MTCNYNSLCATFQVVGPESDQYIATNWEKDPQTTQIARGITASPSGINILGCANGEYDYVAIPHDTTKWTTIFVEWSGGWTDYVGTYNINNGEVLGTFKVKPPGMFLSDVAFIGGRSDLSHYLVGSIASVEWNASLSKVHHLMPEAIKKLMIKDQMFHNWDVFETF